MDATSEECVEKIQLWLSSTCKVHATIAAQLAKELVTISGVSDIEQFQVLREADPKWLDALECKLSSITKILINSCVEKIGRTPLQTLSVEEVAMVVASCFSDFPYSQLFKENMINGFNLLYVEDLPTLMKFGINHELHASTLMASIKEWRRLGVPTSYLCPRKKAAGYAGSKGTQHDVLQFIFRTVQQSSALDDYINTGNRLKNTTGSGASIIECGISQFVETVKASGAKYETAIFSYLDGSSGLGKTQLAFALNRKVLYIPLGNSQDIYRSFAKMRATVLEAVKTDMAALRKADRSSSSTDDDNQDIDEDGMFTATHIEEAFTRGGRFKYYTVSVLLKLLDLFVDAGAQAPSVTNVFLGADCNATLNAMTVDDGQRAAEKYREVLLYLDEIPPKNDVNNDPHDECMFLRNLIRCIALPCLLRGTESTLLDVVTTARGSRCEGREPWAYLLTRFPSTLVDVRNDLFSDYEQHLLSCARPLFVKWFAMCCGALPYPTVADPTTATAAAALTGDEPGRIRVTPAVLSDLKLLICKAKVNALRRGRFYDGPWLHASTLLVFADSLKGSGDVDTDVLADSIAPVGEKRRASVPASSETRKKRRFGDITGNVMHHALLIRKHFALLHVPSDLIDPNGISVLYLEQGTLNDRNHTEFVPKAAFKSCAQDPLLYLACLRGGLMCRGTGAAAGSMVEVPSSYAFSTFRTQSGVGNMHAKSNDGTGLEAECMAAFVLAAHRYTSFTGTPFFRWLALVIAELSHGAAFIETQITTIPEELRAALQNVLVPLLSPPNCLWGEKSMQSGINFGNLSWCQNKDKRDGSAPLKDAEGAASASDEDAEGGYDEAQDNEEDEGEFLFKEGVCAPAHGYRLLSAECKDVQTFGGEKMVTVTKKVADRSVCLLIGSDLSAWEPATVTKFAPDVSVYRMTARNTIKRVSEPVAAADWVPGRKILIALDLKVLHPGRYAALPHAT